MIPKNGQKDPMLVVNHAAPAIDIRICLKIRKRLKIWDGGRLVSQICIHQRTRTASVMRVDQILPAVELGKILCKFKLRFVKIDIQI